MRGRGLDFQGPEDVPRGFVSSVRCRNAPVGRVKVPMRMRDSSRPAGERALVLVPNGFDFLVAFAACLYSNLIAIPAPAPEWAQC
jgi:hypothetical protein